MGNSISARVGHFTAFLKEGLWGKWVGLVYSLAALYVFVRDEIWHPKNADQWGIINMIPHLSLAWWLVGAFAVLCVWIFEASFRITKRLNETIASSRGQDSPLEIIFDPTNPGKKFWCERR
jgi:hypothetical protein